MSKVKWIKTCFVLAGLVCIVTASFWLWHNLHEAQVAKEASATILESLKKEQEVDGSRLNDDELPVQVVDKEKYMGIVAIPSLKLQLPVAAEYRFEQMEKTPTRYLGSYKTNDLVICGHDHYAQFGPLQHIRVGTEVFLKTVDGKEFSYIVTNREVIEPNEVAKVYKHLDKRDGDWDLTFFTCLQDGRTRVLVRCQKNK